MSGVGGYNAVSMADSDSGEPFPDSSFRLGPWLVEPKLNRVSRQQETVQLDLKVMQLLTFLASRAGEVLSRFEILDAVWRTRFVADNTLTHAVAEIRGALGDDPRHPAYVETIPKRGYRLIGPVSPVEPVRPRRPEAVPRFRLVGSEGETGLVDGENLIGREPGLELSIPSVSVSRRHARVLVDGERVVLEDLGSKNGTFLRGKRLVGPAELRDGDEIRIGHHAAVLRFLVEDGRTRTESSLMAPGEDLVPEA